MSEINIIEKIMFNTPNEIKKMYEEDIYAYRLKNTNKKVNLNNRLKEKIRQIKKSNIDNKKAEIIKYRDQTTLLISQIEAEEKNKINKLYEEFEEHYNQALINEKEVKKNKENKLEKIERLKKIKALKEQQKQMINQQKKLLKKYTQSDEEYRLIKNNIKNIRFNTCGKINELNINVLFPPFIEFGKNIVKGIQNIGYWFKKIWRTFKLKHPNFAQFFVFFMISNGVTLLQLALMPIIKSILNNTDLVNISFQFGQVGKNLNGTPYYMFDYVAGPISDGSGGGLAYFLSVQITLAIAQIINFFSQRSITFKSDSNPWIAAMWYFIAYVTITFIAAAAQGLYKAPIYDLFMNTWNMGSLGELFADFITMIINSAISFWVFFPIFKIIFKQKKPA